VRITLIGRDLPGSTCRPGPDGEIYQDIHVAVGPLDRMVGAVAGDAASARWDVDVEPKALADGTLDWRGRLVSGRRGDRYLYLNWLAAGPAGELRMFRRGKVMLSDLDPGLAAGAAALRCTIGLTDAKGNPSCARFRAHEALWESAEAR